MIAVKRKCECGCGRVFEAGRRGKRFASDACRKRAKKVIPANVIAIAAASSPEAGVRVAMAAELERMEAAESVLGATALALAERIDVGNETGAATAALARELRATMEELEAKFAKPAGKIHSLRLMLSERAGGA